MNKTTINVAFLATALLCPAATMAATVVKQVTVTNPLDLARTDAPVVIALDAPFDVKGALVMRSGVEIPSQLDDIDGDGRFDELAFVLDVAPKASDVLTVTLSDAPSGKEYKARTFAQLLARGWKKPEPIREITVDGTLDSYTLLYGHGIMFESELNGYRIYFDPKGTLDPYGKFSKQLELENSQFYPTDSLLAAGYGDDVLMVGSSCGIGALKLWNGTEAAHIDPVRTRSHRLISSGPVRAIVETKVTGWKGCDIVQHFTQWAGHRDVQVDVDFSKPADGERFAVGVQKIMGNETVHRYGPDGTVASWGRHWPVGDTIRFAKERVGIATYIPGTPNRKRVADANGFYFLIDQPDLSHLTYHTMFTSGKEQGWGFDSAPEWFDFMPAWKKEIDNPLIIDIN